MQYTSTSIDNVLARIVRSTRVEDASYLVDAEEWIPEAMGYMKTKAVLVNKYEDQTVKFHKVRMPCGLRSIKAIQYNGCRLRYYNGVLDARSLSDTKNGAASVYPGIPTTDEDVYKTHLVKRPATDDGVEVNYYETEIDKVNNLSYAQDAWYYPEMDFILTSFCDGTIRTHFTAYPTDARGFPMIPDNENYKEALYYYVRAKMIGAGYEDKVFTEDKCMDRFEKHASKAMTQIRYPSVDKMETMANNHARLIMPTDFWTSFGDPSPEPNYDLI